MPSKPDAIILCGGAGVRLSSVTGNLPKVMASVAGRPFLELLLRQVRRHGFERVILAVGYHKEVIRGYFGERAAGLNLAYSAESSSLGTGGALRNAADLLESDSVLVLNGDSYTDVDLLSFIADHLESHADVSLVVVPTDGRADCGLVRVDQHGRVERFEEKKFQSGPQYVNAGIYMVSRTLLEGIASGRPTSLEQELFPQWLEQGSYIRVHVFGGRCIDIGTPERYREAQQSLANVELGSGVGERVRPFRGKDMTVDVLRGNLEESLKVHSQLIEACLPATTAAAEALVAAYRQGHKALFFGNGGSAADAQHLAAEFVGRYLREREPMPALALNTNSSAVTAIGNDYGYDQVFARQLQALAAPGDVAVAISTSGNSPNVIEAIKCARRLGLFTIALTGASGGKLRGLVNVLIAAPSDATPRIQECHILVGHALCDAVERAVANEPAVLGASSTVGN